MVSALDSASSGPGASPGWRHLVVFLNKTLWTGHLTLTVPLTNQVYKWVPEILMQGTGCNLVMN